MAGELSPAMEAEFDTVAEWTARVAADLGPDYYIPAACRGSGNPSSLDWLLVVPAAPRPGHDDRRRRGHRRAGGLRRRADRRAPGSPGSRARARAARRPGSSARPSSRPTPPPCPSPTPRRTSCGASACCAPRPARPPSWPCCASCGACCAPPGAWACWSSWPRRRTWTIRRRATTSRPAASSTRWSAGPGWPSRPDPRRRPAPPPEAWAERTAAVERELQRRYGDTRAIGHRYRGQSRRIGALLDFGELTSEVILLSREYEGKP